MNDVVPLPAGFLRIRSLSLLVGVVALLVAVSYAADRWLRLDTSTRIALLPPTA